MTTMANEIKIQIRQLSAATSEATIRSHKVVIDRPLAKGGEDQGPMGGELFLASIGGCFMSTLLAAIKARQAEVSDAQVEVMGTILDNPARFSAVELMVSAHCSDPELFAKLVEIAEKGCIMVNTLQGKLNLTIRVGAPA
jgi:putative redox protein